jgi:deoxyribodipyrimidine photo-lyase
VHHLTAWKKGLTGYPIIDAGMRELWQTGWMHNRVRMITASFLVKDLLIHWKEGATWFMDTLVDADIANNTSGWQWVSGCGADASPYFRIFNPVLQSEKFDKDGDYIRCFVPELAHLPSKYIHAPWKAPRTILAHAGVSLMETIPQREMFQTQEKQGKFHEYPLPIVNHDVMRKEALECYASIKKLTV